jgi:tetratricopeptide (TPR) repeat protein
MVTYLKKLLPAVLALAALGPGPAVAEAQKTSDAALSKTEQRIGRLIEQLGAEDFGSRERAQGELSQLGLEAYDALHAAQSHHDPEIGLRARYLLRSMSVRWFADTDSPKVVAILKEYGDLPEEQKRNRIDRLAALESRLGVQPLVRLARFETSEPLAKYAALKILEMSTPMDEGEKAELTKAIDEVAGSSKRPAAGWLRLYSQSLADPAGALAAWEQATKAEHELSKKNPDKSSKEIVRDLYRFHINLLQRLQRDDEALAAMRHTFELLDGTPDQISEMVDWLMSRQAWQAVLEVSQRFESAFQDNAGLLYRLAATYDKLDQPDKAAESAAKALALKPENLDDHILIGQMLEDRPGLVKWAEAEYAHVLKGALPGSQQDFKARFRLSELLHDRLQELPAAETLKPVCDLLAKDPAANDTVMRLSRDPAKVVARMHFLFACHYNTQGDTANERKHLKAAIDADETDADVLIAMFRLKDADEKWKATTRQTIESAAAGFRSQVMEGRDAVSMADSDSGRLAAHFDLAIACNQYAWLVGNTFGDFDEAVKLSEEAVKISQEIVELKPSHAGFLDTLGRCYYGAGDLAKAVEHQAHAARLNPDSGQIRRQLEFFKSEAKAKGVKLPELAEKDAAEPKTP